MKTRQEMFIVYHEPTDQALKGDDGKILIFKTATEARQEAYDPKWPWITAGAYDRRNTRITKWMHENGDLQTLKPQRIMIHFGEMLEW